MLQKNKDKADRQRARHAFMGRPVRFDKDTTYDRNKQKELDSEVMNEEMEEDEYEDYYIEG
jgi:hypothetical protein